ncbi:enoyl-CoA hydratase/isomerase family protein [Gordonia sp. zg691]|uniref:Enoyl-CoA hydratase/isomerase family protein n=1 Tax=Gordonia jinghuaiqii TaxID=2758710 RepID=A0A7D7QHR7_9ACTN|nr:enoyl-CoA hydratase/isomerase family protein [Gordonia jinghuaiqii]MBD0863815.1 enoyl-CoA hydratase/isomerase family protein [Gordonia jinghuaiqii]MCR5979963.1 enoyl-CoA hydratase/isomerase family protein [Gordonia jinghuaiqii]QMT03162.1 enoyl-CoA hydratase/isomerase family protein [Gordonia jinghuaiqii]
MPFLNETGEVVELHLGAPDDQTGEANPENRFRLDWLDEVERLLDEVGSDPKRPLVLTAGGKFFSNGLDTDHIFAAPEKLPAYLDRVHMLFSKVLTLPVPTVAAVNGHAFGAGAMLALCADQVLMRTERGFWSLPEAALNMPFTRGMATLLRTRLNDRAVTEAMYSSRRYGAADAVAAGIVDEAVDAEQLTARAAALAAARTATVGPNLALIKRGLRGPLLDDLALPTPPGVF